MFFTLYFALFIYTFLILSVKISFKNVFILIAVQINSRRRRKWQGRRARFSYRSKTQETVTIIAKKLKKETSTYRCSRRYHDARLHE